MSFIIPKEKNQVSGGYRIPLSLLEKKQALFQTPPKSKKNVSFENSYLSKEEIMSQITGVTQAPDFLTSEMLGNASHCKNSKKEIADEIIKEIERKIEKLHRTRKDVEEEYLKQKREALGKINGLNYLSQDTNSRLIIYEGKERKQYAEHEFSSLECLNLQNVQALHEAHRMRLSDLESRYLTEKIKRKDQEDFQNGSQTEINYDRLNVRKKLFSATPLKRISKEEYLHQYDKYLNDKQKQKENSSRFIDFDRYQPTSPNPKRSTSRKNSENKLASMKSLQSNESPGSFHITSNSDLLTKFYKNIRSSNGQRGVLKSDLIKELKSHPEIYKNINLSYLDASKLINQYPSKNPETLMLKEFRDFYFFQKNMTNEKTQNTCLLDEKDLGLMRTIFVDVDYQKDSLVDCSIFIDKLRKNANINKIIDKKAVFLPSIDKPMELGKVFNLIMQQEKTNANKYISWPQFENYFTGYKITTEEIYDRIQKIKIQNNSQNSSNDDNHIDLDKNILQFLQRVYSNMTKKKDSHGEKTAYVKTVDFIESIKGERDFFDFRKELGRKQAERFSLKTETLSEVLIRISDEAGDYIDWKEFVEFFTRKGRPTYLIKKDDETYQLREKFFKPPNLNELRELL